MNKSKDIDYKSFNFNEQLYPTLQAKHGMSDILHPIRFFRVRFPYDSSHVSQVKKERHIDFHLSLICFSHILFAFK
jgi:hypothetical protein